MATRSALVDVRKALVEALVAAVNDPSVDVTYGFAGGTDPRREQIFTDRARGTHDPAALKAGRNHRNERMEFDLVVLVAGVGLSPEETDERALELADVVETVVADHKSNELGVDGLNWLRMGRMELANRFAPNGSLTEITYTITYDARLT